MSARKVKWVFTDRSTVGGYKILTFHPILGDIRKMLEYYWEQDKIGYCKVSKDLSDWVARNYGLSINALKSPFIQNDCITFGPEGGQGIEMWLRDAAYHCFIENDSPHAPALFSMLLLISNQHPKFIFSDEHLVRRNGLPIDDKNWLEAIEYVSKLTGHDIIVPVFTFDNSVGRWIKKGSYNSKGWTPST